MATFQQQHQQQQQQQQQIKTQKIVFIRHGVAKHNLPDPMTPNNRPILEDPKWYDPSLVYQGKQQALEVGERLRTYYKTTQGCDEEIELIITSPLTRCIQTTMYGFLPGTIYTNNQEQKEEPKIICSELIREAYGCHYPDKRREKSILTKYWPNIDFNTLKENDELWKFNKRETVLELQNRIKQFFINFLIKRPETNIVIVSHGVWIEVCLNMLCPEALEYGNRRVYNCDMFIGECISTTTTTAAEMNDQGQQQQQQFRLKNFHLIQ